MCVCVFVCEKAVCVRLFCVCVAERLAGVHNLIYMVSPTVTGGIYSYEFPQWEPSILETWLLQKTAAFSSVIVNQRLTCIDFLLVLWAIHVLFIL